MIAQPRHKTFPNCSGYCWKTCLTRVKCKVRICFFLVFVSNLDFSIEESFIESFMSKSGKVLEVRLIKNPGGKSKGFAYVEFESGNDAR